MTPRQLFTGIFALSLFLSACFSPSVGSQTTSQPTLPTPEVLTATVPPSPRPSAKAGNKNNPTAVPASPVPSAEAGGNNPTAAPPAAVSVHIPDPAAYIWAQVVSGIPAPTDIKNASDGLGRLFIVEQRGQIRILKNGQLLDAPFLDITDRVGSNGSEQGLLGLAFHPKFSQNGYFYVNYTDTNGNTHIARFTASGDSADPASEKKLLFVQQPFPNHNGGALAFGPDGYLYIGLGDGGSQGDPYGNAQSLNSQLGKILRIDVDHGDPFAIPDTNPFAASGGVFKEIWAYGLRNPWRFSFDRITHDLWIGDVGQNEWEEIDFVPAGMPGGLNFGWNKMEGTHPYKGSNQPGLTAPVAEYPHGPECSVTGGYVYRGAALPAWQGIYFYGDYCSGVIWGLPSPPRATRPVSLFQTGFKISTFGVDEAGELYVADYTGAIYRLEKHP
jgi:glucose/arabinose dehydrogenase